MGINVNAYTTGLLRYLKDEWVAKKGGELPDAHKWKIVGAMDSVPQRQNVFYCRVFSCMFSDFIYSDHPLLFQPV